ncbi:glyoxalase superfamily protein [Oceanicoccus sp. KOV_DT_Chl]|uniref:glyoxalase superfamily protein n=1 Tax=Oceanicoccus sp. KOV_DT_Chl TaxID=1904639 RepID=UPI000C79E0DF|nr:glyoxalase superfamily protein [Oceanicoccus sp. KOV_DT_Chl]
MNFGYPIPIFRSFDEKKAKEFYIEFLEFKLDWEHRFEAGLPLYMQISKGGCVIHVTEHHGDSSPGSSIRVEIDELDAFHQHLYNKQYEYSRPEIKEQPWGRDMSIADPFGNKVIFSQLS